MKEVNPKNILLFLIAVLSVIAIVSFVIPNEGISLSDNLTFNAPKPLDIFKDKKVDYADISDIIEEQENITSVVNESIEKPKKSKSKKIDTLRADAKALRNKIQNIQFSEEGKQKLYMFFEKLQNIDSSKNQIRIWHYGDSQIEGARITGNIREKLQSQFGGYGPGLIEIEPVVNKPSWEVKASDNWQTYNIFGKIDTNVKHRKYGPLMKFFTFTSYDTTANQFDSLYISSVEFKKTNYAQKNSRKYDVLRIFYGNAGQNTEMKITNKNGDTIKSAILAPSLKINDITLDNLNDYDYFNIHFKTKRSPDFYAVSFESGTGVIMDNIALRGSSGLFFTKTDRLHLAEMIDYFNVELLIWEFGVNMVSDEIENYGFYKARIKKQLKRLKEIAPELPVIIIGVSDRSKKDGLYYKSLVSVEKVRNAQKEAALESGFAFWDMYQAMGGKNSMPSWVFAEPPLASEDFTHFNHRGAGIISNMFYNALIFEYNKFREISN
jgi:hypothetical protein